MARVGRPLLVLLALLCVPGVARLRAQPPTLPTLTGAVNDFARVLDPTSISRLEGISRSLQTATGDVMVVAVIDSLGPATSIEEYALRLFESAGIGSRESDNGLLVLVAVQDRKVRIEVGYGLEEFVTDGFAGETIRTHLLPAFRQGRYGAGLIAGTSALANRIASRRGAALTDVPAPATPRPTASRRRTGVPAIVLFIVLILVINAIRRGSGGTPPFTRGGRRSTWSGWHGGVGGFGGGFGSGGFGGGGFGGGFGGFGGGRSGGGGASGGW